jgi:hypothetical protein
MVRFEVCEDSVTGAESHALFFGKTAVRLRAGVRMRSLAVCGTKASFGPCRSAEIRLWRSQRGGLKVLLPGENFQTLGMRSRVSGS